VPLAASPAVPLAASPAVPLAASPALAPDAGLASRPAGFDFTAAMRLLCQDMARTLPELSHVQMDKVALRFCQVRQPGKFGVQATLTPLRFAGGELTTVRRGRTLRIAPLVDGAGQEMLYLLSFYLPRFLDLPLTEKLATVTHELWHIGPAFDGDLRRFPGRCYAHSGDTKAFHAQATQLAGQWLAISAAANLSQFLEFDFRGLVEKFGKVHGTTLPTPRLVPCPPARIS